MIAGKIDRTAQNAVPAARSARLRSTIWIRTRPKIARQSRGARARGLRFITVTVEWDAPKGSSPRVCGRQHGASTGTRPAAVFVEDRGQTFGDRWLPEVHLDRTLEPFAPDEPHAECTGLAAPPNRHAGRRPADRRGRRPARAPRPGPARDGIGPCGSRDRIPGCPAIARPHQAPDRCRARTLGQPTRVTSTPAETQRLRDLTRLRRVR